MSSLKDNVIIKVNGENHNHDPKLPENVQTVLVRLKRRVLSDIEKSVPTIYDEHVKKFVSIWILERLFRFFSNVGKMALQLLYPCLTHGNQLYILFENQYYLRHQHHSIVY